MPRFDVRANNVSVHPSMSIGKVIVVPEPLILLEYLSSINFWKQSCIGLLSIYEEGTLQLIFYKGFTFTVVIIPFELILAFLISIVVSLSLSLSLSSVVHRGGDE